MGEQHPQVVQDQDVERRLRDAQEERDRLRRKLRIKAALTEHNRRLQEEMAILDARLEQERANVKRED